MRQRKPGRRFVGPGEKIALLAPDAGELFVWRRLVEPWQTAPRGIYCSVFRRETGTRLASEMTLDAERYSWSLWPRERLYTYVAPWMVRSSNPGYYFQIAGWRKFRTTSRGLVEMEKLPIT